MKNTRMLALILLLAAGIACIFRFWSVVMLFFVAVIIAYLLSPLVRLLTFRGKIPRGIAVAVTTLAVVGLIVWLLALLIPYAAEQITGVVNDLSVYAKDFDTLLVRAGDLLASWHLPQEVLDWGYSILGKVDTLLGKIFSSLLTWLTSTAGSIFDIVVVVILIIYFMLDGKKLIRAAVDALPPTAGARVERVLLQSDRYVWKYVGTRVLISLGMAVVSYLGFSLIGLRYALLFSVLSFVMDFIPYFGSIIAGGVEGVYALITGGVGLAIKVLIFVLVVQQIEGNVIAPKIQGDAVDVHPVAIMFSLLVCSEIWGPVGMLISTPIAAVVRVIVREVYHFIIEKEDPAEAPSPQPPLPEQPLKAPENKISAPAEAPSPQAPCQAEAPQAPQQPRQDTVLDDILRDLLPGDSEQ